MVLAFMRCVFGGTGALKATLNHCMAYRFCAVAFFIGEKKVFKQSEACLTFA
jgi:hypothetical protein